MAGEWNDKVFSVKTEGFEGLALEVFRFQAQNNPVYREYTRVLGVDPADVLSISQIPFLPIGIFKSQAVQTTDFEPQVVFESSGTTGTVNSRHRVKELSLYEESFTRGFEFFYGPVKDWCIVGLLPSYLERNNSSLVYMTDQLIRLSKHSESGFYLDEYEKLFQVLQQLEDREQKTLLLGVSFALLDLAEIRSFPLVHTIIMETGGMKGRREEMTRQELHAILERSFSVRTIHSEYGMTELLSQAYSKEKGIFQCPKWMKVLIREEDDPLSIKIENQKTKMENEDISSSIIGAINVIDLANIYSCSFISTDDVGKLYPNGSFEVLGRMDNSDIRGCSLMVI